MSGAKAPLVQEAQFAPGVQYVPMIATHLPALAELEQLCFSDPWSLMALEEELENPVARFFVALLGNTVVGYGGMHCVERECYIANLAVHPQSRGKGLGRALLQVLVNQAQKEQGTFLTLEVRPSNLPGRALYQSMGFEEVGRRPGYYKNPREDGILMTKFLEKAPEKQGRREEEQC